MKLWGGGLSCTIGICLAASQASASWGPVASSKLCLLKTSPVTASDPVERGGQNHPHLRPVAPKGETETQSRNAGCSGLGRLQGNRKKTDLEVPNGKESGGNSLNKKFRRRCSMVCYVTSLLHLLKKVFRKSLHHSPGLGGQICLPAFSHPGWGTALPRGLVTCRLQYRQL